MDQAFVWSRSKRASAKKSYRVSSSYWASYLFEQLGLALIVSLLVAFGMTRSVLWLPVMLFVCLAYYAYRALASPIEAELSGADIIKLRSALGQTAISPFNIVAITNSTFVPSTIFLHCKSRTIALRHRFEGMSEFISELVRLNPAIEVKLYRPTGGYGGAGGSGSAGGFGGGGFSGGCAVGGGSGGGSCSSS